MSGLRRDYTSPMAAGKMVRKVSWFSLSSTASLSFGPLAIRIAAPQSSNSDSCAVTQLLEGKAANRYTLVLEKHATL